MTGNKRDDAAAEALRAIAAVGADAAAWAYAEKQAAAVAARRMLRSAKAAQAKRGEP